MAENTMLQRLIALVGILIRAIISGIKSRLMAKPIDNAAPAITTTKGNVVPTESPRKINAKGLSILKYYESCRLTAYPDPGTGGAPFTIGWGSAGPDVRQGMVIDQYEADARLLRDLERFERGVLAAVEVKINENQFSALVCLAYNIGLGNLIHSTLLKELNDGDFKGASDQFLVWNKAAGHVMDGLTKRRRAERDLFLLSA
jgi:lysozyme